MDDNDTDQLADALATVARYKSGNTSLIEALMRFAEGHPDAGEFAQPILAQCGMLNEADGSLNWAALEARKLKQQTWEQAVRECITDPAEVERLLALADDATHEEVVAAVRGPA